MELSEHLFRRESGRLVAALTRIFGVHNLALAEDVAQEAWLAALTKRPASGESWSAWMGAVIRNFARARWRSDRRRVEREREVARAERQPSERELLDPLDSHALLVRCVRELDEPYRGAIVLRYFEGLTPKQIAERTDTPLRTVNTHLHRALALLRKRLDQLHRGNRDAWCALLVPLAGRSSGAAAGALIVSTPLKAAIAAAVVAGLIASYWSVERGAPRAKLVIAAAPVRAKTELPQLELADVEPRTAVEPPTAISAASPVPNESSVVASPPRRSVHGIVIDVANRPLPDIRLVTNGNQHDGVPADIETISDARGEFSMLDVPDGSDIDVASSGWIAVLRPQVDESSAALEHVVVVAPRAGVAGDVVDELGVPIHGVRVRILLPSTLRASIDRVLDASVSVRWETRSDQEGRFEFADSPALPGARLLSDGEGFESEAVDRLGRGFRAQLGNRWHAKPLLPALRLMLPPFQSLALRTFHPRRARIRRDEFHVGAQFGDDRTLPAFARGLFAGAGQIAHVRDHNPRPPAQTSPTPMQTRQQQAAFGHIGGRDPTDQRHERHRRMDRRQPQPQGVLLVAHEPAALTGFERAPAQRRVRGGVSGRTFF